MKLTMRVWLILGIVPPRPADDSWMMVFTRGDAVVDSYSGGNLASAVADREPSA
jgi:hypothetical protein